ncbi:MAG: ABC transporter permease subunit [Desulfobacteraceae bacterium]|nr:ABC transporter permease subunit [Desulfobacteraceae bacterium]
MHQVQLILKKEFKDYFVSPIAYIVIAIFVIVTAWLFFSKFFLYNQANLRDFFQYLPLILALVVPVITMQLFSEELNAGSYELLLTLPLSFNEIIIGKFLAASAFVAAILAPSVVFPLVISFLGDLDWGAVIGGYIGAFLLGASYVAIGLFASSLTRNQIIACIVGMAICFALAIIDKMLFFIPQPVLGVIEYLSSGYHFENISRGIVDTRDIVYFASVIFLGLYATHLVMQEKE